MAFFVPYIALSDYSAVIQSGQLSKQILGEIAGGNRERQFVENWAMKVIKGKVGGQYDMSYEFSPTLPYNPVKEYFGGSRVIIDYDEWESDKQYKTDECVIHEQNGYMCLADTQDASFDDSKWQGIGKQFDIYYIPLPYDRFTLEVQEPENDSVKGFYNVSDKVWWADHTYTCLRETRALTHSELIQLNYISDVGYVNTFPTDKIAGATYWKDEGIYKIDAGLFPSYSEDSVWVLGDNRDSTIVQAVVDLALFQLHKRIAPSNIPDLRLTALKMTIEWLNSVSDGKETIDIPSVQPLVYNNIAWGGNPKKNNKW